MGGIVVKRIQPLPHDDRQDLYELVKGLATAETREDLENISVAMLEILDQTPSQIRKMELAEEELQPGLQKWLEFVSGRIHEVRSAAGLTQEQLAEKSGLPRSHISRLENGKHSPSRSTLEKIADCSRSQVGKTRPLGLSQAAW